MTEPVVSLVCGCGQRCIGPKSYFDSPRTCVACGALLATTPLPLSRTVGNAALAVARAMAAVARGEAVLVDRATRLARRAACAPCPANPGGRCVLCGCWVRAKTLLTTEECPHPEGSRW